MSNFVTLENLYRYNYHQNDVYVSVTATSATILQDGYKWFLSPQGSWFRATGHQADPETAGKFNQALDFARALWLAGFDTNVDRWKKGDTKIPKVTIG